MKQYVSIIWYILINFITNSHKFLNWATCFDTMPFSMPKQKIIPTTHYSSIRLISLLKLQYFPHISIKKNVILNNEGD